MILRNRRGLSPFVLPAGTSELSRAIFRMARQGRNAHYLFETASEAKGVALNGEFFKRCSNSTDFIVQMAKEEVDEERRMKWTALLDGDGSRWIVFGQDSSSEFDDFPLLASANINPLLLCAGAESAEKTMPLGMSSGAERSILDDKCAIVVRRNGTVQKVGKKYCTPRNIIGTAMECTNGVSFVCLTPTRRICGRTAFAPLSSSSHPLKVLPQTDMIPKDRRRRTHGAQTPARSSKVPCL